MKILEVEQKLINGAIKFKVWFILIFILHYYPGFKSKKKQVFFSILKCKQSNQSISY
jgi:hypothetical protein